MGDKPERIRLLVQGREELREKWRRVRRERLRLKHSLLEEGRDLSGVRRNREYRDLKKEQKHLSKMIKHADREINRINSLT